MQKQLSNVLFIVILFLSWGSTFSQEREYIAGKLLDAKTKEPVAFASIRIKDRALGIISNVDGSFKIPLKYKDYGDIIEMSSMGYQTKEILIANLSIYDLNIVRLQPAALVLSEAIVVAKKSRNRPLSSKEIVKRAIDMIPVNYPVIPYSQVGYYRDYQRDNDEYVNLNEAILEVFDQGFKSIDSATTKTRMYDYIQSEKFKRDTVSDNDYDYKDWSKTIVNAYLVGNGGNEFSTLKTHDAIRNYQVNTFDFINGMKDGDVLNNHSFKKISDIYLDEDLLHVIHFKRNSFSSSSRGKIYISKNDFAIHKLEYAVYDNSKRNDSKPLRAIGIKGELIFKVTTEYRKNANKRMYLNYISFQNTFQLRQPPKFSMKFVSLNVSPRHFVLTFNNNINSENAADYKNYVAFYKGERIKIETVVVLENQVFVHPQLKTKKQIEMWNVLKASAATDTFNEDLIDFKIKHIKDVEGNLVNYQVYKDYNQFREFFAQKLKLKPNEPTDGLYMHKRKPIFKDQPVVKPDNFDDYWMNTPLKKVN